MNFVRTLNLYLLDNKKQEQLEKILQELEDSLGLNSIGGVLYTLLSELIDNAVRANLKRVFFSNEGYNLEDEASYERGLKIFKSHYKEIYRNPDYQKALEEQNLSIKVDVNLEPERLLIFIENPSILLDQEEERIREKLALAMQTGNLYEYSTLYEDETEGRGLGFAIVVVLIKHLGFNPDNFRIFIENNHTIARLEFPLSKNYVPIRERGNTPAS